MALGAATVGTVVALLQSERGPERLREIRPAPPELPPAAAPLQDLVDPPSPSDERRDAEVGPRVPRGVVRWVDPGREGPLDGS
jgi:hypothetical protein